MAALQAKDEFKMIYDVKELTFSYPGSDKAVLNKASLSLKRGQILSILGPNGAGKTTLLNCMAGLLTADSGRIFLCGKPMESMGKKDIARMVGYVPQVHTPAFNYQVFDFVLMGCAPRVSMFGKPGEEERKYCMQVLEEMGIAGLANRSYMEISGGERQQAMIARAIVQQPEVILFDEPTAHLDYGKPAPGIAVGAVNGRQRIFHYYYDS